MSDAVNFDTCVMFIWDVHSVLLYYVNGLHHLKLAVCFQFLGNFSIVKALDFIYCKVLVSYFYSVSTLLTMSKRYRSISRMLIFLFES